MSDTPPNDGRFRRFMTFQIILHWIVALPYMFLLLTVALLMLSRLGLAKWVLPQLVAPMHKVVGIAMAVLIVETLLAALVGGYWRTVGRDVLHWVSVFWHDIVWLVKVPLNTFFPRQFPLPPAGRFNAGQKLHGLFILCAVSGFIVTGFMMIFRPAWLRPWMIHTWLFFGAVGFLGLHLFLGLINPVTRRALGGMFTGHVPLEYVQAHHALELEEEAVSDASHPAAVSWKAMAAVAVLIASAIGIWWGRGGRESFFGSPTVGRPHGMIMPGMLIAAHADDPKAQRCEACHVDMGPPRDSACLSCHTEIARVMRDRIGYHGQLTGKCASCHADHKGREANLLPLDTRSFNHQLARFSLKGAHQTLQCAQCHVQHSNKPGHEQFVGLETTGACTQCHADPHEGQFSQNCTSCHSERGWTGKQLLFVHNRDSSFHLNGKHEQVACIECHKPQRRKQRSRARHSPESRPAARTATKIHIAANSKRAVRPATPSRAGRADSWSSRTSVTPGFRCAASTQRCNANNAISPQMRRRAWPAQHSRRSARNAGNVTPIRTRDNSRRAAPPATANRAGRAGIFSSITTVMRLSRSTRFTAASRVRRAIGLRKAIRYSARSRPAAISVTRRSRT